MIKRFSEYSINTYLRCPRKFYYRYVINKKITKKPLSINMVFGNIVHNACKDFYKLKIEDRNIENLNKIFRNHWKPNPIRKLFDNIEEEREWGLYGLKILENFYKSFGTKTPFQVEHYVDYKLNEYKLFGTIDRIDINDDGLLSIIDYKTGNYYHDDNEDSGERNLKTIQIRLYAVLLYGNNKMVRDGSYYYYGDNFFDKIEFSEEKIKYDMSYFYELIMDIQHDKYFLIQPGYHCKYCDFVEECQENGNNIIYYENDTKKFNSNF